MVERAIRFACIAASAMIAAIIVLGASQPPDLGAQEPESEMRLASAGPRFLALREGRGKAGGARWNDASRAAVFQRRISLDLHDVTLELALTEVARRSGLRLTYSPDVVRLESRVTLDASNLTVGAALSALLYDAGVDVLLTGSGQAALVKRVYIAPVQGTVVGRVADGASGVEIVAAHVMVEGTRLETTTGNDGRYRLSGVPIGQQTVVVRRIGYNRASQPVNVTAGEVTLDFTLAASATALDQVVVTGTAGRLERRAQAAVIASVDATDVVSKTSVSSVSELLQSRVPGLSVTQTSGSSGLGQRINVRGGASISLSNEPLVFIDGVRMDAQMREVDLFTGGLTSSALNDLKPEEIESIEVVKGPAAATLYGADASAGVIQIITRRGQAGAQRFSQTLSLEYGHIDPNFTPFTNFAACPAALVGPTSPAALCRGQEPGAIVSNNPLVRDGVPDDGQLVSLQYTGRGGGDSYGYFFSLGWDDENGTLPSNGLSRQAARVNFTWTPSPQLSVDANVGLSRTVNELPQNEDSGFGYLTNAYLGSPLLVREDGTGGYLIGNFSVDATESIRTEISTLRYTPSVQLSYSPFSWLTNRITLGADLPRVNGFQLFPKNDQGWYSGERVDGHVTESRETRNSYTLDYLGNIRLGFGGAGQYSSDLSFGVQYIDEQVDELTAIGIGLTTSSAHAVSAAAQIAAGQVSTREKSLGFLVQEQLGWRDRLFLQLGARIDQNSSFGSETPAFFLPKIGASYVISEEPFWGGIAGVIPTLRLRAAYGTTGRAPQPGASLATYSSAPFVTSAGEVGSGVIPLNPGNPDLKAERGSELEVGFDAGLFRDRVALELTYFDKKTTDLLLQRPQPPSLGFVFGSASNPFVNVGEVVNRGVEFAVRGTVLSRPNLVWDVQLSGSTLHNELVDLGDVAPFGDINFGHFVPGRQLGAVMSYRVRSVDTENGVAIVSDTVEFVGNQMPTFEGSIGTTLTLFRNLRLYAQLDGKSGFRVFNFGQEFRERLLRNAEEIVRAPDDGGYSDAERLRRLGPYVTESGESIQFGEVKEPYFQKGDFLRFRELSATLALPQRFANRFGADGASITVAGRNLALWTEYEGIDPEVLSVVTNAGQFQFTRTDLATVPQPRRWSVRLNVQF